MLIKTAKYFDTFIKICIANNVIFPKNEISFTEMLTNLYNNDIIIDMLLTNRKSGCIIIHTIMNIKSIKGDIS